MELPTARLNYTTINHPAREGLGLSWLEYGLADLIYRLSNNPDSDYPNWCYASKETLASNLGITKQGLHKILNRLIFKGLVEKHPQTKHLKITIDWYETVEISSSKQSLLGVNFVDKDSKQSLLGDSKQSLHKKESIEKEINNIIPLSSSPFKKFTSLEDLIEEDLVEIAEDYHVPLNFVRLELEKMTNWLGASGKKYKDYKKALRNWVLKDAEKLASQRSDPTKRAIDARNL